jgi:phage/plasmid-associated DNA primase
MPKDTTCGQCKFYLIKGKCPRAEYRDSKLNATACQPTDSTCELFQPKYKPKKSEILDMKEALEHLTGKFVFKVPTDTEEILGFEDGNYRPYKHMVKQELAGLYKEDLTRSFVEEVLAQIQWTNYIEREEINNFTIQIPIKNGFFNLLTRELEPFDPEQVFTYKLNVKYDPEAECPKWKQFVTEIVYEEDIPLLQEMMGYCLLPAMPYHKLFWLYGTGRNGKSKVVTTLEHILSKDNVSNLNLSDFRESRRFSLCQLYGKLLNVSSEPPLSKYGLQTNVLKMISGEDTIHAELKGKNK